MATQRWRTSDILIFGGVVMMTSYWIVDLLTDYSGHRFSSLRLLFDLCFFLAQFVILYQFRAFLNKRHQLETSLLVEQQHAQDERARAESILEAMDEGISIQDRNFRILYQNRAHKRLVGCEQVGAICYQAYSRQDQVCDGCPVLLTFADGEPHVQEKRLVGSDPARYIEIITSPLRNREGEVVAGIEMVRDVTHRWEVDQEVRKLNERLQHNTAELTVVNRELEAFNYSLSHDLRSPLSQIETASELLAQNLATGDFHNQHNPFLLETIQNGTLRIDQMIQGMLELARIGRGDIVRRDFSLEQLVQEVVEQLRRRDPQRRVAVGVTAGLAANADSALLQIVMQNLLENAWKYTARTDAARIEVGELEENGERIFFVRDNGAGFNPALAQRLFMPFQRLHDARDYPGDGIGLSTVHRIIQRHGGRVWAEGEVGRGATFYFTLAPAVASQ